MSWVATTTFTDEHHGGAISEEELKCREELQEAYKEEINFVKLMVKDNPNFEELSYEDKINFVVNSIFFLQKKEKTITPIKKGNLCKNN